MEDDRWSVARALPTDGARDAWRATLAQPGLVPAWNPSVLLGGDADSTEVRLPQRGLTLRLPPAMTALLDDPTELALQPFAAWPAPLRRLFALGFVYLHGREPQIAASVRFDDAWGVVVRASRIDHFTVLQGGPILVLDSVIGSHNVVSGPVALLRSQLQPHDCVGPGVQLVSTFVASYVSAVGEVEVERSLLGAYAHLDGRPTAAPHPAPAGEGVRVAAHGWIGHHVTLSAGARTGTGAVVVSGSHIDESVGEHTLRSGARQLPIDLHIRTLDADKAFAAGQRQGASAALLPAYGPAQARFISPTRLEIDYPEHAAARGLASPRLLDFHRGALTALLDELVPQSAPAVRCSDGQEVRLCVDFARPVAAGERLRDALWLQLRDDATFAGLRGEALELFHFLQGRGATFREVNLAIGEPGSGISPTSASAIAEAVHRLSDLCLLTVRVIRWSREVNGRADALLASFADPTGRRSPTQPPRGS